VIQLMRRTTVAAVGQGAVSVLLVVAVEAEPLAIVRLEVVVS
jgi:hypothetical protein